MPLPAGMRVVPKKGESKAQARTRLEAKYGDPPATSVPMRGNSRGRFSGNPGPPERNETRGRGTVRAGAGAPHLLDLLKLGVGADTPMAKLFATYSGMRVGPDLYQDRTLIGKPSGLIMGQNLDWGFQSGTNKDNGTLDLGTYVNQQYNYIVRQLLARRQISFRDTTIGSAASFTTWLNNYSNAFMNLRALESVLSAAQLHRTWLGISSNVALSLIRLATDLRELYTFSSPKGLNTLLDKMCGIKCLDEEGTVPILMSLNIADLNTVANITTQLGVAEGQIAALTGTADAQIISNIMAIAYDPDPYTPKGISYNVEEWDQCVTSAAVAIDSTANTYTEYPFIAVNANQVIPMMIRRNLTPDAQAYLLSLFRMQVVGTDALGATDVGIIANVLGFLQQQLAIAATSSAFLAYNQNAASSTITLSHAGAFTPGFTNFELEAMWWSSLAESKAANYSTDARNYHDYDVAWVTRDELIDNTHFLIETIMRNLKAA